MRKNFLYIFILIANLILGQNKSNHKFDSLRRNLHKFKEDTNATKSYQFLARKYRSFNFDSAIYFADKGIALSKKIKSNKYLIGCYHNKASAYKDQGENQKAIDTLLHIYKLSNETPEKFYLTGICLDLGVLYRITGNYDKSLFYFQTQAKEAERLKDTNALFTSYNSMANTLNMMGVNKKSAENLLQALKYYEKAKIYIDSSNHKSLGMLLGNSGVAYFNIGTLKKDSSYFFKAIEYADQSLSHNLKSKDSLEIATNYSNLAGGYHELCNIRYNESYMIKAKKYYEFAISIYEKLNDHFIYNEYFNYGSHLALYGKYKKNNTFISQGINYLNTALELSKKHQDVFSIVNSHKALALSYAELKNYPLAFENLNKHLELKDSLLSLENKQIAEEMAAKYESDLKETENQHLKEEANLREEVITKKSNTIKLMIGAAIILIILSLLVLRSRQKINRAKRLIEIQKKETEAQKQIIEEKNKEIIDSINYAKRLQNAAMPSLDHFKKLLPNSFILYKPKDIVAGDFYWIQSLSNNKIIVAAADCTGHGVPGALVSIVCLNALNRCIEEFNLYKPNEILDKTTEIILQSFRQDENDVKDGMDISLVLIDYNENEYYFSGANNPLLIFREYELIELKGDSLPVGKQQNPKPFSLQKLPIVKNDTLILYTDGYADQFGGEKGKKFKSKNLKDLLLRSVSKETNEIKHALENTFNSWKGDLDQIDDILVIGIKI